MPEAQSAQLPDPLTTMEPLVLHPGDTLIIGLSRLLSREEINALERRLAERLGHKPIVLSGLEELAVQRGVRLALAEEEPPAPAHTYTVDLRDSRAPYRVDADLCGRHGSEYLFTVGDDREPVARVMADTVASICRHPRTSEFPHRGHVAGQAGTQPSQG